MKLLLPISFIILSLSVKGQFNTHSIGLRTGVSSGITYKYFYDPKMALEGILSTRHGGVQLTGLLERNIIISETPGGRVDWFHGYGAHAGINLFRDRFANLNEPREDHFVRPTIGLDLIAGIQYTFIKVPATIGMEYKPYLGLFEPRLFGLNLGDFALSMRINFL